MAPNIYCCGAGTAADTEAVTGIHCNFFLSTNVGAHSFLFYYVFLPYKSLKHVKCAEPFYYYCKYAERFILIRMTIIIPVVFVYSRHGQLTATTASLPHWSRIKGCHSANPS